MLEDRISRHEAVLPRRRIRDRNNGAAGNNTEVPERRGYTRLPTSTQEPLRERAVEKAILLGRLRQYA